MTAASKSTGFDPARLIETHQAGVWRYLRVLGCSRSEADDLTQETFLAVLQKPFEDYNPAATAAYLRRVAHNQLVSLRRREGRMNCVEDFDAIEGDWARWTKADDGQGEQLLAALRTCLQALTERAQLALQMRFRDRRSRTEIAAALEITDHGARNLMQRAKKQLRDCIEGKLP